MSAEQMGVQDVVEFSPGRKARQELSKADVQQLIPELAAIRQLSQQSLRVEGASRRAVISAANAELGWPESSVTVRGTHLSYSSMVVMVFVRSAGI